MSDVTSLQSFLGCTPEDLEALKKVKLVWQRLEALRRKAEKDPTELPAYRDLLEKSLTQARLIIPVDDVEAEAAAFWKWYDSECGGRQISEIEQRRGVSHQEWCAKWLAPEWTAFAESVKRTVDLPSAVNFSDLRGCALRMLQAYVEAV